MSSMTYEKAEELVRAGKWDEIRFEDFSVFEVQALGHLRRDLFPVPKIGILLNNGAKAILPGRYEDFIKGAAEATKAGTNAMECVSERWGVRLSEIDMTWDATGGRDPFKEQG